MNVNVEFLGEEPLDNVITCMHFQMDKTIYFGYQHVIDKHKDTTDRFLKRYCGVDTVKFHALSQWNLQDVLYVMRKVLEEEYAAGNRVYFDITGGESLALVAFGMLSKEFVAPMHMYDVVGDELIELEDESEISVSRNVPKQSVVLNLDRLIELRGGVICYGNHKDIKVVADEKAATQVRALWRIVKKYGPQWNAFSDFIKTYCKPEESLRYSGKAAFLENALRNNKNKRLTNKALFEEILHACEEAGALADLECGPQWYRFRYTSGIVKGWLCDAGSVLELYRYLQEREGADDCRVGVSLDWDGVIHAKNNQDVHNEVDVLVLRGNIPTFISCKNGNVDQMALYELETIADQFGGKYAKKAVAATQGLNSAHGLRAAEMGIEEREIR